MTGALLDVRNIDAGYSEIQVLRSVSFQIGTGEVATLLGRNGMGKTTTIRTLMGQLPATSGSIRFAGEDIANAPVYRIAQAGIGLVPEGRAVFSNLSVRENLLSGAANRHKAADPWTIESVYRLFPRLQERRTHLGSNLSGGEQQMVAIGRALMTNPRLLILDEATEGLAPLVRREIWVCLAKLKEKGLSMLIVDKNLGPISRIADRHCVLEKGRVVWQGDARAFAAQRKTVDRYLTVEGASARKQTSAREAKISEAKEAPAGIEPDREWAGQQA
jgi:branched-chain amino acid transport system ATP-binding protein